ncbi:hypothetical protein PVW51_12795 [Sulfitobacter sp. PR48]|nr:hypothetical protein [Sulfitobacter sp. PR48]
MKMASFGKAHGAALPQQQDEKLPPKFLAQMQFPGRLHPAKNRGNSPDNNQPYDPEPRNLQQHRGLGIRQTLFAHRRNDKQKSRGQIREKNQLICKKLHRGSIGKIDRQAPQYCQNDRADQEKVQHKTSPPEKKLSGQSNSALSIT